MGVTVLLTRWPVRTAALRWVAGVYFLLLGASLLILPRPRFSATFDAWELRGALAAVSGLALLWLAVTALPRWLSGVIHLVVAATQLAVAAYYFDVGTYTPAALLALLSVALLYAAVQPAVPDADDRARHQPDLLGLVLGGALLAQGADLWLRPTLPTWVWLQREAGLSVRGLGAAFLLSGAAVVLTQLVGRTPAALRWAAHLGAGALVLTHSILTAIHLDAALWVLSASVYLRAGALAALPWWSARAARFDGRALRPRLTVTLLTAALLPLLLGLPLIFHRVEQDEIATARAEMEGRAREFAGAFTPIARANGGDPAALTTPVVADRLRGAAVANGQAIAIIDERGQNLIGVTGAGVAATAPPAVTAFVLAQGERAGAALQQTPRGEQIVGYAPVADSDWRVIVERPRAAVLSDTIAARRFGFAALIVAAALGAVVAWWLADRFAAPLGAVVRALEQIVRGDRPAPLAPVAVTELRRLASTTAATATALAEREAARTALLAAEQEARSAAETAVQLRNHVLRGVGHDLKTPLATLMGTTGLLERQLRRDGALTPTLADRLRLMGAAADQMNMMLSELSDAVRLQAGEQLPLSPEKLDLVELVGRAVEAHRQYTENHQLVLSADAPTLTGLWDRMRLERVVDNLLSNAVKYSPAGGVVRVVLRDEAGADQRQAVLTVTDEGIGIPAADLPHVFEPFRRATNVGEIVGVGLGLAGAKAIIEQHGGAISVMSAPGAGATFTVHLPLLVRAPVLAGA